MDGIPLFRNKKSEHLHLPSIGVSPHTHNSTDIIRELHHTFPGLGHLSPVTSGLAFSTESMEKLDVALNSFVDPQDETLRMVFDTRDPYVRPHFSTPVALFSEPENTIEIGDNLRKLFNIQGNVTIDYLGTPPSTFPRYLGTLSDYINDFDIPIMQDTHQTHIDIPSIVSERSKPIDLYTPSLSSITRFFTALGRDNTRETRLNLLSTDLDITRRHLSAFKPLESLSVATELTDGFFRWSVPPSSDFATILIRGEKLSKLLEKPTNSLNCWEGCLLAGHIAGQLSEQDIASRFALYTTGGEGLDLLMRAPEQIWKDIGFYKTYTSRVPTEKINDIPEGHLVYFVPTRNGEEVHPTDPGQVKYNAFRKADHKIDGALSTSLHRLLTNRGLLNQNGIAIQAGQEEVLGEVARTAIQTLQAARVEHINTLLNGHEPLSFQNPQCDIGAYQSRKIHEALNTQQDIKILLNTPVFLPETANVIKRMKTVLETAYSDTLKYSQIHPFPDHVVISLGGGLCESLWNTPNGIYQFQRVHIDIFAPNHNVYAGPPIWLQQ